MRRENAHACALLCVFLYINICIANSDISSSVICKTTLFCSHLLEMPVCMFANCHCDKRDTSISFFWVPKDPKLEGSWFLPLITNH